MIITREYLINLLNKWQGNTITACDVYETACRLYCADETKILDWEGKDEISVTNEVLLYLDALDTNFITQEDIEPCKEFLQTPVGKFDEGYKKWQKYKNTINYESRMEKLKGHYPYVS